MYTFSNQFLSSSLPMATTLLTRQIMAAMLQPDHPFIPSPHIPTSIPAEAAISVLSAIPSLFFLSPRSVGRQLTPRHRSPLRPRRPTTPVGPAAHRDPSRVRLGVAAALRFYYWIGLHFPLTHNELTCRAMCRLLARANALSPLWHFLKQNAGMVTTPTVTETIKVLGEEGLVKEALAAFYRMKQLHCKPDTQSYNTIICALCRVGSFQKARFLLAQMELPGARCPPDSYTYTILISAYCKHSLQTGCRKAIRRRIWEANHMFRHMVFMGFVPDIVTYNCLIDGLCKTYRVERARELFDEMLLKGCLPNRVTYSSFVRFYSVVNEVDKAVEMMRMMVERKHGMPSSSTYTPIIHSLCEAGRVREAKEFLVEMVDNGHVPREFTYKLVCDTLSSAGEEGLPSNLCRRIEGAMDDRYRQVMRVKPIMPRNRFAEAEI